MRVAMYYGNRDVRLEERPVPRIGSSELLLRVEASGICGSDVMEWYRRDKIPLVLGHEIGATVAAVGGEVSGYRLGDRVCAAHHVPCNTCYFCLRGNHTACDTLRRTNFDPGGFAEFVRLPAINVDRGVFRLPEDVSFEDATFIEPLACVLRGQRRAGLWPGGSVLILGSGIAGLLHLQLAIALGAGRVICTDVSDFRLAAAKEFGAEAALHASDDVPGRFRQLNGGRLADVVIVTTGAATAIDQGFRSVERGGTMLLFAPPAPDANIRLPFHDVLWRNDISLTTSYAGSPADHAAAMELIRSRRVRVREMVTHRVGLAETQQGFLLVAAAQDSIKVIVRPQE